MSSDIIIYQALKIITKLKKFQQIKHKFLLILFDITDLKSAEP